MPDDMTTTLRMWAASGLTRNLYAGATPLCDTLRHAADMLEDVRAERDRLAAFAARQEQVIEAAVLERTEELRAERDRLAERVDMLQARLAQAVGAPDGSTYDAANDVWICPSGFDAWRGASPEWGEL
jgi:hypothetical protein